MTQTDFELALMSLENNEKEILRRMRKGVFTNKEAGYIVAGIVHVLLDREKDPEGFYKRMERIQILIDNVIGKDEEIL